MKRTETRPLLLGSLAVLGAWALTTLVSASSYYLDGATLPGYGWFKTVAQFGSIWILWIVVAPVIVWLARRFPVDGGRWPKALAVHLGTSLVWAGIYFPATLIVLRLWSGTPILENFLGGLESYNFRALHESFIYWVIAVTAYAFWNFKDRNDEQRRASELAIRNAQIGEELIRSELRTLRDQLHPHFLFNTLNSIAGLIRTDDRETALQVLSRLSELLRYTLETELQPYVPVATEIEFIRQYLEIQQVRFRDRLSVSVSIEPGCESLPLPSMILQPLVENAVHHGAVREGGRNEVDVHVGNDEGALRIRIRNTTDESTPDRAGHGIGLQNVRERLVRIYEDRFELDLHREDDLMTVTLTLPGAGAEGSPSAVLAG